MALARSSGVAKSPHHFLRFCIVSSGISIFPSSSPAGEQMPLFRLIFAAFAVALILFHCFISPDISAAITLRCRQSYAILLKRCCATLFHDIFSFTLRLRHIIRLIIMLTPSAATGAALCRYFYIITPYVTAFYMLLRYYFAILQEMPPLLYFIFIERYAAFSLFISPLRFIFRALIITLIATPLIICRRHISRL